MLALFLSATFLAAAAAKLRDPWQLRLTVRELIPSWPRPAAHSVTAAVLALEWLVPALFIAGPRPAGWAGAIGTVLLTTAFAGAFGWSRRLPYAVRCHCFGRLRAATLSGWTLASSLILLASALGWTQVTGNLATFSDLAVRLLAVVPAAGVLIASGVPRSTYSTGVAP